MIKKKLRRNQKVYLGVAKGKWKQPAHYQEKVKKEPENEIEEEQVLSCPKKVKRKIPMPETMYQPLKLSKAKRGRSRQLPQGKSVMKKT